jgi:hypothetical protein
MSEPIPGAFVDVIPEGMVIDPISNSFVPRKMFDRLQKQRLEKALERARGDVYGHTESIEHIEREAGKRTANIKQLQKLVLQTDALDSATLVKLCLELRAEVVSRDENLVHVASTRGYLEEAEARLATLKEMG